MTNAGFSERKNAATRAPTLLAVLVLFALWALFFWRLLTPADVDRAIFQSGDFTLHLYAFSDYQVERLWDSEIPLWNPYNYGGDPFAANIQAQAWYPPRYIAMLLAGPDGWRVEVYQMEVALHYWLTSVLMFVFLRVLVQRSVPALLGSLLWTYGGFLTGFPMLQPSVLASITWLPPLLLGVHLSVTDDRWRVRGILLSAVMLALAVFGGHAQTTMLMAYLAVVYVVFLGWQNWLRIRDIAWRAGLLGIASGALAAVQLLPTAEFFTRSLRAEDMHYSEKAVGFTYTELAQLLWPRLFEANWWPLYVGVIALLLVVLALLRPKRAYTFWFGVIVAGLLLSLGGNSVVYDVFYTLMPVFSAFRQQERAAFLVAFAAAVIAAHVLAHLLDDDPLPDAAAARKDDLRRLAWLARGHLALTVTVFLVFVVVVAARGDDPKDVTANAFGFVALISLLFNGWLAWRGRAGSALTAAALGALIVMELFTLGMNSSNFVDDTPYNRVQEPDFLDLLHKDVDEIDFHVDGAAGLQARSLYWRIPDIYGVVPLELADIHELRSIRVDRRWEVFAVRYATMIADVPENVPVEVVGEGTNYDGEDYTLYELSDPRPFAHLVYEARFAEDHDDAHDIMAEPWIDLRQIAVVTGDLPVNLPGERPDDAAVRAFKMVQPEYMEMEVSTGQPALLTLPVANYPGWRAEVNGARVDIVDTYAGLIGIPIAPGAGQKVTLQFLPTSVIAGGIVSATALVIVLGAFVSLTLRNRRAETPDLPRTLD